MRQFFVVLGFCAAFLGTDRAFAQCQGGGGGTTTGTTALAATPTLLTGQGSLAFQMARMAAVQQQLAQMQMLRAQQAAVRREASLAKRQANAERTRLATAERRERARQALAAQNGVSRPAKSLTRQTPGATQLARR